MSLGTTSRSFLNTSRDSDSTTSLCSPFQLLTTLFGEVVFPNIQPEFPLVQLENIPSSRITSYMGKEANSYLTTPSIEVVAGSDMVCPESPLLQTR